MNRDSEYFKTLAEICHSNLKNSTKLTRYLKEDRGISDETINSYKIGYFPQNIKKICRYIPEDFLIRANIINNFSNSQFSEYFSLIFPIVSEYGDFVGISGRTLAEEEHRKFLRIPKYKNSSYKKSNILFGLDRAKEYIVKTGTVHVVEGYFDQISMSQSGIKNTIAICGTAFSKKHFIKLSRYCDKMIFILDNDDAGINSSNNIYNKYINKGIKIRLASIPNEYKDVDEYFLNYNNSRKTFISDIKNIVPNF